MTSTTNQPDRAPLDPARFPVLDIWWDDVAEQWECVPPDPASEAWHGCPHCPPERGPDDIYGIAHAYHGACHEHRTIWFLGVDLTARWTDGTEAEQRERLRKVKSYAGADRAVAAMLDAFPRAQRKLERRLRTVDGAA